jgi:hypothetical protein
MELNRSSPPKWTNRPRDGRGAIVLLTVLTGLAVLAMAAFFHFRSASPLPDGKPDSVETAVKSSPDELDAARTDGEEASDGKSTGVPRSAVALRKSPPSLPAAPSSAAAPASVTGSPDADGLIARLTQLEVGKPLSAEQAAAVKEDFQRLIAQGAGAVPAIDRFLRQNRDFSLDELKKSDSVGYASVRAGMFDVLRQIGGPEAESALLETLRTTGAPSEIALLARHLEELAPGRHREEMVGAARETLAYVAESKSKADVGSLFQVLQSHGDAAVLTEIQKTMPAFQHYAFMALVGLPDGQGIPALIQQVRDSDAGSSARNFFAVQMLAQVAPGNAEASAALVEQAKAGRIPERAWQRVGEALSGDQYRFAKEPGTEVSALLGSSGVKTYHINSGNENFYSVPLSNLQTQDGGQRLALIDQLLAANPGREAVQALQKAKAALAR